jgi:hypothetical protein
MLCSCLYTAFSFGHLGYVKLAPSFRHALREVAGSESVFLGPSGSWAPVPTLLP